MREATQAANEAAEQVGDKLEATRQEILKSAAMSSPIVLSAEGDCAIASGAESRNAVSLVTKIQATQSGSGDPSPDNVRPITGWNTVKLMHSGRNMIRYPYIDGNSGDTITKNGLSITFNADGSVHVTGTASTTTFVNLCSLPGLSGANVTEGTTVDGISARDCRYTYANGLVVIRIAGSTTVDKTYYPMLTADEDTTFEAYQGTMLTAELPETVYGGAFNWTTGELTVTHRYIQMADMYVKSVGVSASGALYADLAYPDGFTPRTNAASISNAYQYITTSQTAVSGTYRVYNSSLTVYDDRFESVEAAESILQELGFAAVVELPFATTVQLTPQQLELLKGYNTIWSDTGDTSVSYVADTKTYIDEHLASAAEYAEHARHAEEADEALNAQAIGGMAVRALSLTEYQAIANPDTNTIYLIFDDEEAST